MVSIFKNYTTKVVALLLVCVLIAPFSSTCVHAATSLVNTEEIKVINGREISVSDYLTEEDYIFFSKLENIFPYFELSSNNELRITLSDEELVSKFNLTDEDLSRINELIEYQKTYLSDDSMDLPVGGIETRVFVSDWKIYFYYDDVVSLLFAAAQIGPAAIMAALSAVGSVVPGAGTVVGGLVGLIGGGTICYYVIQAALLGRGLYIGIDWNGPFPNPVINLW